MNYNNLTVRVQPGAEKWAPTTSWWRKVGRGLPRAQTLTIHPRSEREEAWAADHKGRKAPGNPYSFRAYTVGATTRVFVDDTETPESVCWLILHELAHANINHIPTIAKTLRQIPRPANYATSDVAHEQVPEEQVANRVADILAPALGGKSGLNRIWWRSRIRTG